MKLIHLNNSISIQFIINKKEKAKFISFINVIIWLLFNNWGILQKSCSTLVVITGGYYKGLYCKLRGNFNFINITEEIDCENDIFIDYEGN